MNEDVIEAYSMIISNAHAMGSLELARYGLVQAFDGVTKALEQDPALEPELLATLAAIKEADEAVGAAHRFMLERLCAATGLNPEEMLDADT